MQCPDKVEASPSGGARGPKGSASFIERRTSEKIRVSVRTLSSEVFRAAASNAASADPACKRRRNSRRACSRDGSRADRCGRPISAFAWRQTLLCRQLAWMGIDSWCKFTGCDVASLSVSCCSWTLVPAQANVIMARTSRSARSLECLGEPVIRLVIPTVPGVRHKRIRTLLVIARSRNQYTSWVMFVSVSWKVKNADISRCGLQGLSRHLS